MSGTRTCGNPLPCKWYVQYAALERDHIKKWEQIDALQRENDELRARAERLVKAYCCPHAWACDCFIDEMDDFRAALSTSDAK